ANPDQSTICNLKSLLADVALGSARHFFDGGLALQHLAPAVLPQRDHAFLEGLVADGRGVGALHAHVADRVAGDHQLVDAHTAAVTSLVTRPAAGPFPEHDFLAVVVREIAGNVVRRRLVLDLAIGANGPHQALGHDALDRAGDQERLDA